MLPSEEWVVRTGGPGCLEVWHNSTQPRSIADGARLIQDWEMPLRQNLQVWALVSRLPLVLQEALMSNEAPHFVFFLESITFLVSSWYVKFVHELKQRALSLFCHWIASKANKRRVWSDLKCQNKIIVRTGWKFKDYLVALFHFFSDKESGT